MAKEKALTMAQALAAYRPFIPFGPDLAYVERQVRELGFSPETFVALIGQYGASSKEGHYLELVADQAGRLLEAIGGSKPIAPALLGLDRALGAFKRARNERPDGI